MGELLPFPKRKRSDRKPGARRARALHNLLAWRGVALLCCIAIAYEAGHADGCKEARHG